MKDLSTARSPITVTPKHCSAHSSLLFRFIQFCSVVGVASQSTPYLTNLCENPHNVQGNYCILNKVQKTKVGRLQFSLEGFASTERIYEMIA